jgi:hypothetical protein
MKCSNLPDERFPYTDRVGDDGVILPLFVENGNLIEGFQLNMGVNRKDLLNGLDGVFYDMKKFNCNNYNK